MSGIEFLTAKITDKTETTGLADISAAARSIDTTINGCGLFDLRRLRRRRLGACFGLRRRRLDIDQIL
jgi:hypothetical protein